ncbi:MAG: cytochrome b [Candidatus Poseidoniaceae archaeon]
MAHTKVAKTVHWSFIVLYSYGMFKQLDDISQLEDNGLLIFEVIFASVFLIVVLLRYFYMRNVGTMHASNVPVHRVHIFIAKSVHTSMYLCLILLPLSGLAIAFLFKQGIVDGPLQNIAIGIHEFMATLSYVLIAVHVSAAIYSRVKGEGVWSSMVPILKEEGPSENEYVKKIADLENLVYEKISSTLESLRPKGDE